MKWFFSIVLLVLLSCNKKEEQTWKVNYRIISYSSTDFEYRVNYLNQSGSSITKGPNTGYLWVSDTMTFNEGSRLFMEMTMTQYDTDADLQIIINGHVHEERAKKTGENSVSLTYQL